MDIRTQFNKINTGQKAWLEAFEKVYSDSVTAMKREKLTMKIAMLPIHTDKNRYNNVSPYDQNRVILEKKNNVNTDYINASPVAVSQASRNYILSQGPVPDSLTDFWQMVFENNVPCIVMLNRLYEGRSLKCEMYYPNKDKKEVCFKNYTITLLSEEEKEYFVVRKLKANDGEKTMELFQIQYTEWPDFGVPESTAAFLDMLNYIKGLNVLSIEDSDPPTIVHCSAGIGRSGTFVLVDSVLRMIELGVPQSEISVHDLLIDMRCQRFGLVQTGQQLRFAWQAIVDGSSEKLVKESINPAVDPTAQDVCKKRRSESQEDPEDRLSKRVRQ
ncbi:unnamed protein product [Auanema sp. JU1783]|nr:unnamed protein product [Auanema sp. JU1783]